MGRAANYTMTHVVGVGYLGSYAALCDHLCATEDDLEETLEDNGLILFDLEDGQCFVVLQDKHQLLNDCCTVLDHRTTYTPSDLCLIQELTGSTDERIRICQLRDTTLDGVEHLMDMMATIGE